MEIKMKISFIIPAYNCEAYIERCIDSLLLQKDADLDIVVVNDGSTDGTAELLEKYKSDVTVKTIPNGGCSNARNVGLSIAQGDFIMFADADDYLSEGAVERLVKVQRDTDADIVKFSYKLVFPDGSTKTAYNQFEEYEVIDKNDFKKKIYPYFINGIRLNSLWSGLYRRELIDGRSFRTDMKVAEDAVFSLGSYTRANRVVVIPDALYNYYQTGEGLTGSAASVIQKYKCNLKFAAETVSYLKEWGMDGPVTRAKVYMRPLRLTFDKLRRIKQSKA